jgi:hypothetical protein
LVAKLRGFVPGSVAEAGESYNHLIEPYLDAMKGMSPRMKTIEIGMDSVTLKRFVVDDVKITSLHYNNEEQAYGYMVIDKNARKRVRLLRDSNCDGILDELSTNSDNMVVPKCLK